MVLWVRESAQSNPPVGQRLIKALKDGKVKEKRLDDMVVR